MVPSQWQTLAASARISMPPSLGVGVGGGGGGVAVTVAEPATVQ